ncbi:hypothetical protein T265_01835 [Opisthorchis viverrini]|uniref:Uncharacterized protein n=1 Tax=Opisthorchis viverrini TaxID=6198 RepID=A0A074ZX66_OPIVI|nr:hypothetical protein T265_01835 [Opisthorchis viverrini]KER32058.1 hypothetical protein T265_01835 [Opisthorchis viverrini]
MTWQQSTKTLTSKLIRVGNCHLPGWVPRGLKLLVVKKIGAINDARASKLSPSMRNKLNMPSPPRLYCVFAFPLSVCEDKAECINENLPIDLVETKSFIAGISPDYIG